ncbi:uncharacterized protein [Dysidea avara]|uniref:uncharacterized protein n=1 Tax=Dysidea avara TaxID=196820 RepID=UPI00332A08FF
MAQQIVTISENCFLYCCSSPYSITFPKEYQLPQSKKYYVLIGIPDKAPENIPVEVIGANELFVKKSPKLDYPYKVHASVQDDCNEKIAEFSLDLLSPVDYVFRKLSLESCDSVDKALEEKMSSAVLAMSLSYYLVMEEQVGKNTKMDEILSSLLRCSSSGKAIYKTALRSLQGANNGRQIKEFCERNHLNLLLQEVKKAQVEDLDVNKDDHEYETVTHPLTQTRVRSNSEYDYICFEFDGTPPPSPSQSHKSPPPRPPPPDVTYGNVQTSPNVTEEDPYIAMHPRQETNIAFTTDRSKSTSVPVRSPTVPPRRRKANSIKLSQARPRSMDSLLLDQSIQQEASSSSLSDSTASSPQHLSTSHKLLQKHQKPERPPRPKSLEVGLDRIGKPQAPRKNILSNLVTRRSSNKTND